MAAIERACLRDRRSIAQAIGRFWHRIEPGLTIDHGNSIESWDGEAEGRATSISFEGFGITFLIFVGRTPKSVRS